MRPLHSIIALMLMIWLPAQADISEIRNLKQVNESLITGGQPDTSDIEALAKAGVKTVINFRAEGEFSGYNEQQRVEEHGMQYRHFPIDAKAALNKANVQKFHDMLNATSGKTFLHCGSGNRVGALFALEAFWHKGATAEEAIEIGKAAGLTKLQGYVETVIKSED